MANVPPSPLSSAYRTINMYFTVTMRLHCDEPSTTETSLTVASTHVKDQRMIESAPSRSAWAGGEEKVEEKT